MKANITNESQYNPFPLNVMKYLSSVIKTHGKELTATKIECVTNFQYKSRLFYSVTKIHKQKPHDK